MLCILQSSVETVITTLDPGMKEVICMYSFICFDFLAITHIIMPFFSQFINHFVLSISSQGHLSTDYHKCDITMIHVSRSLVRVLCGGHYEPQPTDHALRDHRFCVCGL